MTESIGTWIEQGEMDTYQANQHHGDYCYGTGYDRRWAMENLDGTWHVLTVSYYPEGHGGDGLVSDEDEVQVYTVTRCIETTHCTDKDDAGETELDRTYEYDNVSHSFYLVAEAEAVAKHLCENEHVYLSTTPPA